MNGGGLLAACAAALSNDVLGVLHRTVDGGDPGGNSRDELVAWLSAMPGEGSTRERVLAVTKFLELSASDSTSSQTVYHARRQAERGRLLRLGVVVLVGDDGRQRNALDLADPEWGELIYRGGTFREITDAHSKVTQRPPAGAPLSKAAVADYERACIFARHPKGEKHPDHFFSEYFFLPRTQAILACHVAPAGRTVV